MHRSERGSVRLTLNVLANFAGTAWGGLVQLLLVPFLVRRLGAEGYGLVGLFATLLAIAQVLDLGLSPTVNRELARAAADGAPGAPSRDLVRTLEWIYGGAGALLGLGLAAAATLVATRWVQASTLPREQVALSVALMGLALALEWPSSCYRGALLGLQRQGTVNAATAAATTAFGLGAVAVVHLAPSPVAALFAWRAAVSLAQTLTLRWLAWRSLRAPGEAAPARFRLERLTATWRFSAGMTGITIAAIALMQGDKIVLSRILPLELFGEYMVAATLANLLPMLVGPVFAAFFPRLSTLVAAGDRAGQAREFHLGAQLVTTAVHPAALGLVFCSDAVIELWTGDAGLAGRAGPALALLAGGAVLNSAMVMPYALQLAHGWTRLGLAVNALLVALLVPYTLVAAARFGLPGAASAWLALNALYLALAAPPTLRRLLPGEGRAWLLRDLAWPLGAAALAGALGSAGLARHHPTWRVFGTGLLAYAAALAASGRVRLALADLMAAARGAAPGPGTSK